MHLNQSFLLLKHKPKNQIIFLKRKFKKLNYKKLDKISLHTPKISKKTSSIAKINNVRKILKTFQTNFSNKFQNCCIEGRDISTKILPKSDIKFFFKCNLNTASFRRWLDLKKKVPLKEVKKSLRTRTLLDKKRRHNPLKKVVDAVLIRTDILNKKAMVAKMSKEIDKKLISKYGRNFKTR